MGFADLPRESQKIVTLDAERVLSYFIRSGGSRPLKTKDGLFVDRDAVLHAELHLWCPLFDQLAFCLDAQGVFCDGSHVRSDERFKQWFLYIDFSSLNGRIAYSDSFFETSYGKVMKQLIEEGFTVQDADHPDRIWHYSAFDKSSSNSRNSVISFLADRGYDGHGQEVGIYDALNERLCLDMDFPRLQKSFPQAISWNKYYAYRALYLSNAEPITAKGLVLNEETVLVVKTDEVAIPGYAVLRSEAHTSEEGASMLFSREGADTAKIGSKLFDGEGLIHPEYAQMVRESLNLLHPERKHSPELTSFQIRMPFAKGVLHEVDFLEAIKDILGVQEDEGSRLMIEDAFGIKRSLSQVRVILTTDMLKGWKWLAKWVELLASNSFNAEADAPDVLDPMKYYFDEFERYHFFLYVLSKRKRLGAARKIPLNAQYLSTLCMTSEEFDGYVSSRLQSIGDLLFDMDKAIDFLCDAQGLSEQSYEEAEQAMEYGDDQVQDTPEPFSEAGAERDAVLYALRRIRNRKEGEEWLKDLFYDPYIYHWIMNTINSRLLDLGAGKLPVDGTLRLLSHDLLWFLFELAKDVAKATEGIDEDAVTNSIDASIESMCLQKDSLFLPAYALNEANPTGLLAVLRNPHLSRSEQCVLHPLQPEDDPDGSFGLYEKYFGHLRDVAMVSCLSPVPMILGGADYDGDTIHIYDDAQIARAILAGAYQDEGQGRAEDASKPIIPPRRYPIADLSDGASQPEPHDDEGVAETNVIGKHITPDQLLKSFRSSVGLLSNSALRLSSVLYGRSEWATVAQDYVIPDEDLCAYYTLAVGRDIDSVKTGVRLDTNALRIGNDKRKLAMALEPWEGDASKHAIAILRGRAAQGSTLLVSGKLLPPGFDIIKFRKETVPKLRWSGSRKPLWKYGVAEEGVKGALPIYDHLVIPPHEDLIQEEGGQAQEAPEQEPVFTVLDLSGETTPDDRADLKGASVSNVQRLPWLVMQEARRIGKKRVGSLASSASFIGTVYHPYPSPLERYASEMEEGILDESTLEKLGGLIGAYQVALFRWMRWRRAVGNAAEDNAFGKARRLAQESPTQFSEDEVEGILMEAEGRILEYLASDEQLEEVSAPPGMRAAAGKAKLQDIFTRFEEQGFETWALCPSGRRKEALRALIPVDDFGSKFYDLMDNDALVDGFMIPFYLVQSAGAKLAANSDVTVDEDVQASAGNGEKASTRKSPPYDKKALEEFVERIRALREECSTQSALERALLNYLRERMEELNIPKGLQGDYLCVLKYQKGYFSDGHRDTQELFWNLLTPEDLEKMLG